MKKSFFERMDRWHLEVLGIFVIALLLMPLLFLCKRDGMGSFVFESHDQLDETILNYVFPARYFNCDTYEQMMCGVPKEALKPFCPIFVPLYMVFNVYSAFLIQYVIVLVTSFFGMYLCVKKLSKSSVSAFVSASVFCLLPVHCVYGNVVMGTPLLIYAVISFCEKEKLKKVVPALLIVFYGLSTSFSLNGWAALCLLALAVIIDSISKKRFSKELFFTFLILLTVYILCNIDLFVEVFSKNSFVSHRVEFGLSKEGIPFFESLFGILSNGTHAFEAESRHEFLMIPIVGSLLFLIFNKGTRKYLKLYLGTVGAILLLSLAYAFLGTGFVLKLMDKLPGMLSTFQLTRFYYFIPGLFYILLGISCAIIIEGLRKVNYLISYVAVAALCIPVVLSLVKDKDGIFYQNVNQINNGEALTGYITMQNLYSDNLMASIESAIGKDMSTYRVAHIGISPVASLIHGFYTVDGYSNNYPLSYKHEFREVIGGELELNDYIKTYYDKWGSRCCIFYHEWGNANMLNKSFEGTITDLRVNISKLKELNCQYIFTAGRIVDCEAYGLKEFGEFTDSESYWRIFVYEID